MHCPDGTEASYYKDEWDEAEGTGGGVWNPTHKGACPGTQWAGLVTKGWVYAGGSGLLGARRVEGNYSLLYKLNKENN